MKDKPKRDEAKEKALKEREIVKDAVGVLDDESVVQHRGGETGKPNGK